MTSRMGFGSIFGTLVLLISAAMQLGGSALILRPATIKPSRTKPASYLLLAFVALQPFMYGQVRAPHGLPLLRGSARRAASRDVWCGARSPQRRRRMRISCAARSR